jgi:acyl dehydratase
VETSPPVVVGDRGQVLALTGRALGPTGWCEVDQDRVDRFARAVDDWHWAHNEPERAGRGPFGGPIGHAHLTLSLVPSFLRQMLSFTEGECLFYGYDRVRFPLAVPVGARLRAAGQVVQVDDIGGGEQLTVDLRVEVEGHDRPACAALAVWRLYHLAPPE